jgi:predicted nucleotidyltransferase
VKTPTKARSVEIIKNMNPLIENNKQKIAALCRRFHIKKLYAFGSVVTGGFSNESDIDLLYEFDYTGFDFNNIKNAPYDPFLFFFDLKEFLENLFQRRVDLIPYQDFKNKYFKEEVEKTKQLIYAAERFDEIFA